MKVLWMTNVPSPYRVDFFNQLGQQCDLTVLFEDKITSVRDKSWLDFKINHFQGVFLRGVKVSKDVKICFDVIRYIDKARYDFVIVTNFTSPTGMLAIEYMRLFQIGYWLESDGGFAKSGKGFRERIKRHFIHGAQLYLSTSAIHDAYYLQYGADIKKIIRYPFTSISDLDVLTTPLRLSEKEELRKQLNITEEKIILTIGQFVPRKGFDLLLHACTDLKNDVGIYFVGGKATADYLKFVEEHNMTNVHFIGFRNKQEIEKYYKAADFFVLPTREDIWGLVINEAMAYGLPVVTTNKCISGIEMVKDGVNGYIVESENVCELKQKINVLLESSTDLEEMKKEALNTACEYTYEKMVERHMELFERNK